MIGEKVPSKIDWWMHLTVWGVTIVVVALFVWMFSDPEISFEIAAFCGVLVFGTIGFLFWLYLSTYYILEDDHLFCRSGPLKKKIPYDSIKTLKLSRNSLSSMALSLDRIEIREEGKGYLSGTTLISPVNREEFYAELKRLCQSIR